jgi:hypothetical protein
MKNAITCLALGLAVMACGASDDKEDTSDQTESAVKACKPERQYVSHDPSQCMPIRFMCVVGRVPFSDAKGCGCECAH